MSPKIRFSDTDTGHQRLYGLMQSTSHWSCGSVECTCIVTPICVAVFSSRDDATAFRNLLESEQTARSQLMKEQQTRLLFPYEEPVLFLTHHSWEIHSLALNPKNSAEVYTS